VNGELVNRERCSVSLLHGGWRGHEFYSLRHFTNSPLHHFTVHLSSPSEDTMDKESDAFRTISEVAEELDVPKHVLRFWEVKFPQIRPMKRGGGRRYYRPEDLDLLRGIRHLLHAEGYMIKGVQKILREQGVEHVKKSWRERGAARVRRGTRPDEIAVAAPQPAPARRPRRHEGPPPAPLTGAARERVERAIAELRACRAMLSAPAAEGSARRGRAPADG
jgi:DNA-binding transcriptional MerR regulator